MLVSRHFSFGRRWIQNHISPWLLQFRCCLFFKFAITTKLLYFLFWKVAISGLDVKLSYFRCDSCSCAKLNSIASQLPLSQYFPWETNISIIKNIFVFHLFWKVAISGWDVKLSYFRCDSCSCAKLNSIASQLPLSQYFPWETNISIIKNIFFFWYVFLSSFLFNQMSVL